MRRMRVLVAPDKLKGCLTAPEAARAMARGVERVPGASAKALALADGGEGTLEVLVAALGGTTREHRVHDALGRPVAARLGLVEGGRTAIVESAEAIGLARLDGERRLLETSSYGLGELVAAALDAGAGRILVALGGSATNDGGAGAMQALGAKLDGVSTPLRARELANVAGVDRTGLDARLAEVELVLLTDVASPLLGPRGASLLFAAQKGASEHEAHELERALARFASFFELDPELPGAGAAGGLGFGLAAIAGARLTPGAPFVLDAVGFDEHVRESDLVLTAEGSLDGQSLLGKLAVEIGRRARGLGVPAVALAGRLAVSLEALAAEGIVAAFPLADGPLDEATSLARGGELIALAAERVTRLYGAR